MATKVDGTKIDSDYPGSENHHSLKDQPGEKGKPVPTEETGDLPDDVEDAIKSSDDDTEMADKLKSAIDEEDTSD